MNPEPLDKLIVLLGDVCRRMLERATEPHRIGTDKESSDALMRLKRGEISADEYLDIKVDLAMTRLRDLLPDDDFGYVRAIVRDRIETDPVLAALAQRLTRLNAP